MTHRIRKGLDVPISGRPRQVVEDARPSVRVALLGRDFPGLRPSLEVASGDSVRCGQVLFRDKARPAVAFTAPAAGTVVAVHRGERRAFESIVIKLAGDGNDQVSFSSHTGRPPSELTGEQVRELLVESGLWTALRARPFSHVADPGTRPRSIFVTAIDTDPLAPDVAVVLRERERELALGLAALAKLTDGPLFLCTGPDFTVDLGEAAGIDRLRHERFDGPHPAGTVGLHIHTLDPVSRDRTAWHVGYQDVVAIGALFETGRLETDRVVALAGPGVKHPRLLRTRIGAATDELCEDELATHENRGPHDEPEMRVISGSVLSGRTAMGAMRGHLGRFHRQVSVIPEWNTRELMAWAGPGLNRYSSIPAFLSSLWRGRRWDMNTAVNGSPRAIVPIGLFEKVFPFDIPATFLLKALITGDDEKAEQLGCLELDEEDLSLCTFVCSGKNEYSSPLRAALERLEKEG